MGDGCLPPASLSHRRQSLAATLVILWNVSRGRQLNPAGTSTTAHDEPQRGPSLIEDARKLAEGAPAPAELRDALLLIVDEG